MLKGLKYLDYELIDNQMRDQAQVKYGEANNDAENAAAGDATEDTNKEVDQELIDARIDCTERMLDKIINEYEDV
jgi:hypothetical protein